MNELHPSATQMDISHRGASERLLIVFIICFALLGLLTCMMSKMDYIQNNSYISCINDSVTVNT